MATDAIVAIQDMGAAGLTSSSVEMASKGGAGIRLNMNKVPCREEGMTPYEMMLSESQERMLMVLQPGKEPMAEAIFRKWELDFAVIGEVTDTGHMVLEFDGEVVCDIPLDPLADDAPLYDRPHVPTPKPAPLANVPESTDLGADLLKLIACPDLASRRWIWEQYDSQVGADTMQKSGGDAAVVRIHGTKKALAMSTDCSPRYCFADPYEGGKQAVVETYRNISAVGATPLAITNCLNFANPQRPEIMGQIVGCLEGMGDACRALDYPIVSGNVSLYNESKATGGGSAILPTPAIGGVGLMADHEKMATIRFKAEGEAILLIGESGGHLGQSLWLREIQGREEGPAPPVDLAAERRHGEFVRELIADGKVTAVHDVSDGGLLVALTEMAMASGIGCELDVAGAGAAFGEDQARYVVTGPVAKTIEAEGIAITRIGTTGGTSVRGVGFNVPVATLCEANERFFKDWMEG
jgi:phosphoribosylformylglycinamidine synthase